MSRRNGNIARLLAFLQNIERSERSTERDVKRYKRKPIINKHRKGQGKKMAEIVKNIASESEKCGYNPEKDTNWDILPMEMRAECIKRMDFKTRIQVRNTSKIEQTLVDTRKLYFDKLFIETEGHSDPWFNVRTSIKMKLVKPDPLSPGGMERCELDGENLSSHVIPSLRNCEFGEIQCFAFGNHESYMDDLKKCAPFRFKSLKAKGGNLYMAAFFLLNSAPGVENINLNVKYEKDFAVADYFYTSFINAKRIVIEHMTFEKLLKEAEKLAGKWSEDDVEIGTKCHFYSGSTKELNTGKTKKKMTISMNNESKIVSIIFNFDMELRQGDVEAYVVPKSE